MDSTGDTSCRTSYNKLLEGLGKSDVVIGIKRNKASIIKNNYSYNKEVIDEDTIIKILVGILYEHCKVDFFLDSFKIDLFNAMKSVYKAYNMEIKIEEGGV